MAIKIRKHVGRKTAEIFLPRLKCTEENILKVLDLFAFQNVILSIADVDKADAIFEEIERLKLKYTTSLEDASSPDLDIVLLANAEESKGLIGHILESDVEVFSITNLCGELPWGSIYTTAELSKN